MLATCVDGLAAQRGLGGSDDHHRRAGFRHALTVPVLSTLDAYVHAFAAHRLHAAQAEALDRWLPAERYPHLSSLVREHVLVGGYDEEEAFAFGLEFVLDGLERRLRGAP